MTPARKRTVVLVAALGLVLAWSLADLYGPRQVDIRRFDPVEVARLDTAMWHSYYDRRPLALFLQLAELMRRQFHFPWLRSHVAAFHAARAAFAFKRGRDREDYSRALPDLVRYYAAIDRISTTRFDVPRTAQLELEWWIIHRQRDRHRQGDLERAVAEAAAALYRVPPASLMEYGHWRTEAMDIRDKKAASGGVREEDWRAIERDLRASWRSLWKVVQPPGLAASIIFFVRRGPPLKEG